MNITQESLPQGIPGPIVEAMNIPQFTIMKSFPQKLKDAAEQGLLLFVKYALVLILAYFAVNYFFALNSGAQNGTQAAIYLNELQKKGYLPGIVNGQIPDLPKSVEVK